MKIILLLALFGIAFCQDEKKCEVEPVSEPDDVNCLANALMSVEKFWVSGQKFACEYNKYQKGGNEDNFHKIAIESVNMMECLGCKVEELLAGQEYDTFQKLLGALAEGATDVGHSLEVLLNNMGFAQPIADTFCTLEEHLISDCIRDALGKTSPEMVNQLEKFSCESDENSAEDAADTLALFLEQTACAADEIAGTGTTLEQTACAADEIAGTGTTLKETLQPLDNLLKHIVKKVLHLLQGAGLAESVVCTLVGNNLGSPLRGLIGLK